jgi:hypothetical protein
MVLQICRSDQIIDGLYVVIDNISSYENLSFSLNILFFVFSLLDGFDKKMCASVNQMVKGESSLLKKDELGITLVLKHAEKYFCTYDKPSNNTSTC